MNTNWMSERIVRVEVVVRIVGTVNDGTVREGTSTSRTFCRVPKDAFPSQKTPNKMYEL